MSKFTRSVGGPNGSKICVQETKFNFEDWDRDCPFSRDFQFKKNYLVRVFGANSNAALISLVLWVLNNWEIVLRD